MKRTLHITLAAGVMLTALIATGSAWGSFDWYCNPQWKLKQSMLSDCGSLALMGPGNDTRVNLLMLLFDRHGTSGITTIPDDYYGLNRRGEAEPFSYPFFAQTLGGKEKPGEDKSDNQPWALRCSNDSGAVSFKAALTKSKGISAADASKLVAARTAMRPQCSDSRLARSDTVAAVADIRSDVGQQYARYLVGAAAFYNADYPAARAEFAALVKAKDPWVSETANYMLGRAALNEAMLGSFDQYGSFNANPPNINKLALANAEAGFLNYLSAYPRGQYAVSARGLMRKVYWLGGNRDKLLAEYAAAFDAPQTSTGTSLADLVQEFDIKLLSVDGYPPLNATGVTHAATLAVIDLRAMRLGTTTRPSISRAEIEKQKPHFADNDALYHYLLAAHSYYVANKPADVLKIIPEAHVDGSYLAFSRQLLRALALDAVGDAKARAAFVVLIGTAKHPFQRGAAELALAMHDERHNGIENVFSSNSVVRDPEVREILLRYHAGPALLRKQATAKGGEKQERDVAIYTLLYKQLTRGFYKDFLADLSLIPAGTKPHASDNPDYYFNTAIFAYKGAIKSPFGCAPVKNVVAALANNPKDAAALLCLGDFIRHHQSYHSLDELPPKDELGGTPSQFPGKPISRLEIYKMLILDPAVSVNDKSYALYRAINCYTPSGNNSCGGTGVPVATRKAWFTRLKKEFATTKWAKKQEYYW